MAISPNSEVRLLTNVLLPHDKSSTFYWASESAQRQYFQSFTAKTIERATYIRKGTDEYLAVPYSKDDIININYIMYKNTAYENKWFYAFVSEIRYINDNVSHVYIEEDSIQTWYFNMQFNQTFIERQHSTTDNRGDNLVDEPVSTGSEFDIVYDVKIPFGSPSQQARLLDYDLVFVTSDLPSNVGELEELQFYNYVNLGYISVRNKGFGSATDLVYSGLFYVTVHHWSTWTSSTLVPTPDRSAFETAANVVINAFVAGKRIEAIISAFMMPDLYRLHTTGTWSYSSVERLHNYTPFNNKLFTHPYNYGQIWTMNGNSRDLSFEDFDDGYLHLETSCDTSPQPLPIVVPTSYKGLTRDYSLSMYLSPLPQIAWTSDQYLTWAANYGAMQTSFNVVTGLASGAASAAASLAIGNPVAAAGTAASLVTNMVNTGLEVMRLQSLPDVVHGNQSADFVNYKGLNTFNFRHICLRSDYARIVDDYFTMFGYAQKKLAIPNIHARSRYTYIKTVGDPVHGNIPGYALDNINSCFKTGITFWDDKTNFLDYNMSTHPNSTL